MEGELQQNNQDQSSTMLSEGKEPWRQVEREEVRDEEMEKLRKD